MSLNLPEKISKYAHDDIVKILIELNPTFFHPNRGSWQQGIPDLENPIREVVEVALTKLRDAWGQCLYYYRSGATHVHLVLSPRLFVEYQIKEVSFIKANPIPEVDVYKLPSIPAHPKIEKKKRKPMSVRKPEAKFIVTKEETEALEHVEQPKFDSEEGLNIGIDADKFEVGEYPEVEVVVEATKPMAKDRFTCSTCKELIREEGCLYPVCRKYNWEIAQDLTERDAVCVE